ncbi:hypothetical protein M406DRAFT_68933 [Cryphonectria parasitica EP155]|uniref:Rhodopsin domain-containing protein n=1 Tax=Cryphonectria parasitica (strain ATCC 38755 / EP155) TaxID=660469 RepID=A0A9P4Y4Z3_CRYP1|nr:uncharacterized protein M406DRAFT_68933 [Cryphonectria parasitica EP155]KAF3766616.1 hypothetical protein M406DRAFT_68933 [Cryphonectria parasitica EP155]
MAQARHPDRINSIYVITDVVSSVFTFLATICVLLRFIQRRLQRDITLGWDDWTILAAFFFAFCVFICDILLALPNVGAGGYNTAEFTPSQLRTYRILSDLGDSFYTTSVALSKTSVLLFYRRIFSVDKVFLILMRVILFIIFVAWFVVVFFIAYYPSAGVRGLSGGILAAIIGSILVDLAIFTMLQFKVWLLQLSMRRKVLLSLLIVLGLFSIVASLLRLLTLARLKADNYDYGLGEVYLWANVEMFLYIICACLPVLYNLVRVQVKKRTRRFSKPRLTEEEGLVTIGRISTKAGWTKYSDQSSRQVLNSSFPGTKYKLPNDSETLELNALELAHLRGE